MRQALLGFFKRNIPLKIYFELLFSFQRSWNVALKKFELTPMITQSPSQKELRIWKNTGRTSILFIVYAIFVSISVLCLSSLLDELFSGYCLAFCSMHVYLWSKRKSSVVFNLIPFNVFWEIHDTYTTTWLTLKKKFICCFSSVFLISKYYINK